MTAATQLAVFYATGSKVLRRKVIPDSDVQLVLHQPGPGESRLLLPLAQPHDDASCRTAIAAATGVAPAPGRCCIIDRAGHVIGVCHADPALDTHPAGTLMASDLADPGDRFVGGQLLRRYAIIDNITNRVTALEFLTLANPTAPAGSRLAPAGLSQAGDVLAVRRVASA